MTKKGAPRPKHSMGTGRPKPIREGRKPRLTRAAQQMADQQLAQDLVGRRQRRQ